MTLFVANNLEKQHEHYSLLTEAERQKLIEWNHNPSIYSTDTFIQLFEQQVEKTPFHIALSHHASSLTYHELNDQANQLAHYLKNTMNTPSPIIGICLEPSIELLIGILAILKIGSAYLPLDPIYPFERLGFMLEDAKATALITTENIKQHFNTHGCQAICIDTEREKINEQSILNLSLPINDHDLAYVIYTSGSTGKPKGVMLMQRNLQCFMHWFDQALNTTSQDVFDFSSSISFDFSVPMTLFPLIKGARIAICDEKIKKDPLMYIQHLISEKITIIKLTPSYFRQLKEFITLEQTLPNLRLIIFGGEVLLKNDIKNWLEQFPHQIIMNEYGPTEATVATTWLFLNKENIGDFKNNLPIGKPATNTQIYVLNNQLQILPIGEIGEIYIGGVGVAKGYLNLPDMTHEKFIPDPFNTNTQARLYKTGDLGRYTADGYIEFLGRIDHQVKIRGFRIEIGEIEECLTKHTSIKQAIVIIEENQSELEEKKLIAYCLPKNLKHLPTVTELRDFMLEHVPDYMVPANFVFIRAFPLTQNEKIDRKALALLECLDSRVYIKPENVVEEELEKIWKDILHTKKISTDDDFFELGGNSLAAARMINKVRNATHREVNLTDLYEAPTIIQFANVLNQKKEIIQEVLVKDNALRHEDYIPLSELQYLFWLMQNFSSKLHIPNIVKRKRLAGKINLEKLSLAFEWVLQQHDVLRYFISHYYPAQLLQPNVNFKINMEDISHLTPEEQSQKLYDALNKLKDFSDWKKGDSLMKASLFYLGDNCSEIHIGLAHIISDEISPDIIFHDLSHHYVFSPEQNSEDKRVQFKDVILLENNLTHTLQRDIQFWEDYLLNINSVNIPTIDKLTDETQKLSNTTYLPIPNKLIKNINRFIKKNKLTATDVLCAAVASVLEKYVDVSHNPSKNIVLNFVKSTRDNELYDKTVGLFIRTDLIKVDLADSSDFLVLSKAIQSERIKAAPYQFCPEVIKLAAALKNKWKDKKLINSLIAAISIILAKLMPKAKLNPDILTKYGEIGLVGNNYFFVNVNILNNFFTEKQSNADLFGYSLLQLENYETEKMAAENVLDICFARNEQDQPCLVISGNVNEELRVEVGDSIIRILELQS
jgi:amino acid adenylation domain-containing protein